jgi:hypothetical protein
MSDRCEPPEDLRDRDGWHWLKHADGGECIGKWVPSYGGYWSHGEGMWAPAQHGWRYLALVAPAAMVRELVEALEAMQAAVKDLPPSSVLRLSDDLVTRFLRADGRATAALLRAKEAGV